MKNKFRYWAVILLSCIATFTFTVIVSAETHSWKWANLNSDGEAYLLTNGDNLNSSYSGTAYTNGVNLWNNSSGNISIALSSFSYSNVDIYSVTESTWKQNGWGSGLFGWAQVYNEGSPCFTDPNATGNKCFGKVNYAGIFLNDGTMPGTAARRSAIIAHEIGHVVGLAHTLASPVVTPSIMNAGVTSNTPTSYDITNLNAIYR
ncbi:hypothetical protein [Paenibacillus sp. Y412MC10]|uniref:hypothetical protein n=1 Tax=Geobacillus sp. (strain Y412MC10) TaxID=481743 RepID=UPI0001789500|nr:hypothetical protein [Paenibacillus sp. Y412MC10]ACX63375.1 hypothetical protein GYMC10_1083 [Paenibacillus sp. Y412MC10]